MSLVYTTDLTVWQYITGCAWKLVNQPRNECPAHLANDHVFLLSENNLINIECACGESCKNQLWRMQRSLSLFLLWINLIILSAIIKES